jgi:hypothetical protein
MAELPDDELIRLLDRLEGFSPDRVAQARRKQESEARRGAVPRSLLEILKEDGALDPASERLLLAGAVGPHEPTRVLADTPGKGGRRGTAVVRPP